MRDSHGEIDTVSARRGFDAIDAARMLRGVRQPPLYDTGIEAFRYQLMAMRLTSEIAGVNQGIPEVSITGIPQVCAQRRCGIHSQQNHAFVDYQVVTMRSRELLLDPLVLLS